MTDQLESINPATEEVLARFPAATPDEIETAIAEADAAQRAWRRTSFDERAVAMRRLAAPRPPRRSLSRSRQAWPPGSGRAPPRSRG